MPEMNERKPGHGETVIGFHDGKPKIFGVYDAGHPFGPGVVVDTQSGRWACCTSWEPTPPPEPQD